MTISRRTVLKMGVGTGIAPVLLHLPLGAEETGVLRAAEAADLKARPLPLSAIRLTGGPLGHAQQLDARYLLELEPDRMLAYYRERAGLAPKAQPYDGWDGGGRNLTGHIGGHYLSAVSLMYAATGDARFKERADYIVSGLKEVQDRHGDGFLSALEGVRRAFGELQKGEIRSAAFDLNGEWSPWYTLHKTYAGLRDAYRHAGNRTALEVEIRYAGWAESILEPLDDAQIQRMLNTEFGGMNEVMVDLYADTGDERWLRLSYRFEHTDFIEPLLRHQDNLAGKHGNTQVPKLIGSAKRYIGTGEPDDLVASSFFWDRVVQHHSFATGGHGTDEYFGPPDRLSSRVDGRTAETCNVYNMIKLTRLLFAVRPDPEYADFHERALFNHIMASIDPEDGRTCYMVPVGRGVQHEYQNMMRSFTCCVGSGMESHALHGFGLYYESADRLWVNLYAPSTAEWKEGGVRLAMETEFPEGETAKLTLTVATPHEFTLALRRPFWADAGFAVRVNGQTVPAGETAARADESNRGRGSRLYAWPYETSRYVEVKRTWRTGDTVEVTLPRTLRLEPVPDNPRRVSILWGPIVLAGDLGPESQRGRAEGSDEGDGAAEPSMVPVFVAADQPVSAWVRPVPGSSPVRFRTDGVGRQPDENGRPQDIDLVPFYRLHRRRYSTYWDLFTPETWEAERAAYALEAERMRLLEAATVAYLEPGETVFEREFGYEASESAVPQRIQGRPGRRAPAGGWFSYEVPVEPAHPMTLVLTFFSDDRRAMPAHFDILVDGQAISEQQIERTDPSRFYTIEVPVPEATVEGKQKVRFRFQARPGSQVATVFGLRLIRADARRE